MTARAPLVIACGALRRRELRAVLRPHGLADAVEVALPAGQPAQPARADRPGARRRRSIDGRRPGATVFVAYADCGTGGALDRFARRARRTPPGSRAPTATSSSPAPTQFAALHDAEPGTFYLTDFLAKHFDALVWQGLGLDRHPELRDMYFGNYRRVVLLSQTDDPTRSSTPAGPRLTDSGSTFEHRHVGRRAVRRRGRVSSPVAAGRADARARTRATASWSSSTGATSPPRSTRQSGASVTRCCCRQVPAGDRPGQAQGAGSTPPTRTSPSGAARADRATAISRRPRRRPRRLEARVPPRSPRPARVRRRLGGRRRCRPSVDRDVLAALEELDEDADAARRPNEQDEQEQS